MRRMRDGVGTYPAGVGVRVEGIRFHIVGAMSSNPDKALCGILVSTIATMSEKTKIQRTKGVLESNRFSSKR